METDPESRDSKGFRFPLGLKLSLALLGAGVLTLVFLFAYFGPSTTESFLSRSERLISLSSQKMRQLVRTSTAESSQLLIDVIHHLTDERRRSLQDLPLPLYQGDEERIRKAIVETDDDRGRRLSSNVEILAREMENRSLREVDRRLEQLADEQTEMGKTFAADLKKTYLVVAAGVFLTLVGFLGFGLYQAVVIPVRRLRKVTQAVTRGDLQVVVPASSQDEVGELSHDFASMVMQLRDSREAVRSKNLELKELNRNLSTEVARKTEHLSQALQDLRGAQKQLLHAEKMASVGKLAGGVAHEFNNLIGGIRGCAEDAMETAKDEESRETLSVILRAARRATGITDQLLRFSKQRALRLQAVDVTKVLDEAWELIAADARKRGIVLSREMGQESPVPLDPDALHQVFLNLLTNALQAMPSGGELEVKSVVEGGELRLEIKDSGIGIPDDQIDRIFEPFFTTKDREVDPDLRGTGLGLSVCYSLVEAHGGSIEVTSEVGVGSVFTISIPIRSDGSGA